MEEELISFLYHEFKDRKKVNSLLRDAYSEAGISNLDIANPEKRRTLAMILKSEMPTVSIARGNLLFSRILSILNLEGVENINTLKLNPKEKKILEENIMVKDFWSNVDKSLMKFEIIFNMFWLRAGEAEARGMSHSEVLKITKKAMAAVKKDLERAYFLLKEKFNLDENSYILKNASEKNYVSLREENTPDYRKEKKHSEIEGYVEEFWKVIVSSYAQFERIFFDSLNKEIKLRKKGVDDNQFIEETRKRLSFIWAAIENGYKDFQRKLNEYHEKYLSK